MGNLTMENEVKLVHNKNNYLKWASKPSHTSYKIFGNNLVTICKSKVVLTLNKFENIGMCFLELSKVLMYKFHYDYIKNKNGNDSKLLFTNTNSLMYEIKTEGIYEDFSTNKEMFYFNNYLTKSNYYDDSDKLVVKGKMKPLVLQLKNLSDWSQRCICFWQMTTASIKKQRVWMVLRQKVIIKLNMSYWIKNGWGI